MRLPFGGNICRHEWERRTAVIDVEREDGNVSVELIAHACKKCPMRANVKTVVRSSRETVVGGTSI